MSDWTVEYTILRDGYRVTTKDLHKTVRAQCETAIEAEQLAATIPNSRVLFQGEFWMNGGHYSRALFGGATGERLPQWKNAKGAAA